MQQFSCLKYILSLHANLVKFISVLTYDKPLYGNADICKSLFWLCVAVLCRRVAVLFSKDGMLHLTRLYLLVEWNIPSFISWKYSYQSLQPKFIICKIARSLYSAFLFFYLYRDYILITWISKKGFRNFVFPTCFRRNWNSP